MRTFYVTVKLKGENQQEIGNLSSGLVKDMINGMDLSKIEFMNVNPEE